MIEQTYIDLYKAGKLSEAGLKRMRELGIEPEPKKKIKISGTFRESLRKGRLVKKESTRVYKDLFCDEN